MSTRRALITGGSGAIGAAICRRLAADGCHVIVHANSGLERAQALCADLLAQGHSAETVCFDVTDAEASRVALERLLEAGPIQVVVNNAGVHAEAAFPGAQRRDRVL